MKYYSAYSLPKIDDKGYSNDNEYLQVNSSGYYEFDETYNSRHRKHGRQDYLLVYNHYGMAKVRSASIDYDIGSGTVFLYRPGEEQYYGQVDNHPIKSYWVHFTGYAVPALLENMNAENKNIFYIGVNNEFPTIIKMITTELQEKKYNFQLYAASLLQQLLVVVARRIILHDNSNKLSKKESVVDFTINYIHVNYAKKVTVTELASMAGLCSNRYINIFKEVTGLTPKEYIINFRLQKAKELLTNTNLSIGQIADIVGFEDQLYFSRLFKKKEKISPSRFGSNSLNSY